VGNRVCPHPHDLNATILIGGIGIGSSCLPSFPFDDLLMRFGGSEPATPLALILGSYTKSGSNHGHAIDIQRLHYALCRLCQRRIAQHDHAFGRGQVPPGTNPATGARPGHEPGTGESLPLSNKASNIGPTDTRSTIAPTLPGPAAGEHATTQDYLRAARAALVAGRTGQAQQSLEMAETRSLDRSVAQGQTNTPSESQLVSRIRDARRALRRGDRTHAIQLIDLALTS
jgi:hypothetical protein